MIRSVITVFCLLLGSMNAADAEELPELVRALNSLQNRMAVGDILARQEILKQSEKIEKIIPSLEPESWREERNVRAAALYLLSGGAPRALREIFDADFMPPEFSPLLEASLRHAEGRTVAASNALLEFDARGYPRILGGHIALVQGGALLGVDKPKALSRFDLARLLTPVSLVEEAALRRQIAALDPLVDARKFLLLANRYAATYSTSPYAQNFWRSVRAGLIASASADVGEALEHFAAIIDRAGNELGEDLYFLLARKALLEGRIETTKACLAKAEQKALAPAARKRVEIYRAAIANLVGDVETPIVNVDWANVQREDVEALKIMAVVSARFKSLTADADSDSSTKVVDSNSGLSSIAIAANRALEKSDMLLARTDRR